MAKRRSQQPDVPPVAPARKPPAPAPAPEPPRRHYTARGIAGLLAPVVRPAFRRRAPAAAELLADWDMLAGPDFAALARPVKFAGGTLTLACTGPVAMALQYRAPALIARLNLGVGHNTVERLRFVQQAPATPAMAAPARRPVAPPPANLPEGDLGEALAALYKGLSSRA